MAKELSVEEREQLRQALLSAFPSEGALEQVLYFQLDQNLREIREGNNYNDVIRNLIIWAESNNKTADLIDGARKVNPGNPKLREFAAQYHARRPAGPTKPPSSATPLTLQLSRTLVDTLLKMPNALSFEGRSILLIGIPWTQSLNRDPTNARGDLTTIIDQLNSLGPLDSGTWPLLILVDNALSYVTGTVVGRDLRKVRQQLAQAYGVT